MPVTGFLEGMYDVKERQARLVDTQALAQLRQAEAATSIENLQTQRQTRQILQKFLGASDPQEALSNDDPRQARQMDVVGRMLMGVDPKLGLSFQDKASEIKHRAVIDMKDAITAQRDRRKVLGGILGAVDSPEGYPDAVQEFLNQGGSLKEIPWYTGDWNKDKVHVQQYAKSSMAADVQAQRALGALNAGLREDELSRRTARDAEMAREAATRAEQAARNEEDRQRARDRAVARRTIGLQHEEGAQVATILAEDKRLQGMSQGMKDAITSMIGNRVKQRRIDAPDADFKGLVDDELDSAIEKGEIIPGKQAEHWWQSREPPKLEKGKPSEGKPAEGIPTVKSDADYAKIPSGAEYIAPDGKKRRKR